ncbi:YoaK family protein [Sphingomonas morindae]|uniref:DUF1275 domain-containing protein n=1 Tax=Sphingomonas morindae TaxID=1541170 RepID=A0ABY4X855_9SPHN|nr:YoaK family protein [Sphingomonas morindae]USI73097.1 DUF1275 domain-containing protein [Sphingomonas morindae]
MLDRPTPDRKAIVLLLLAIAGCVDAVGLAETGQYFVSFMSGNTTRMGLSLAYGQRLEALLPLGLVALFVGGTTLGALIMERSGRAGAAPVMVAQAALLALASWGFGTSRPALGVLPLPVAMGLANIVMMQNGTVQRGATYATGTLVRLGVGLARLGRRPGEGGAVLHDFACWLALLAGAIGGALGRLHRGDAILAVPAAALLVIALVELIVARRAFSTIDRR